MLPNFIKKRLLEDDQKISKIKKESFRSPVYNPLTYYKDIAVNNYFYALLLLRHYIKLTLDNYFGIELRAKNLDLFIMTNSVTSPSAPGSDSKPIKIKFGKLETFLVDSSQFGFEPLLLNNLDKVYCYLPSMRGEDYDYRHLNQFFHCEFEMMGTLEDLIPIIEKCIKSLCNTILLMDNIINRISSNVKRTKKTLTNITKLNNFSVITFDEAVDLLIKNKKRRCVNFTNHGRNITYKGEIELMNVLRLDIPIWIKYFDRDRVPFYQKPYLKNKTINADLLFPPLSRDSLGGEIVGSGQRQNDPEEIYESLKRQDLSPKSYEWYLDLRRLPNYRITSGFGLGIERFIAWALAKKDIKDVILYPRLKNIITFP